MKTRDEVKKTHDLLCAIICGHTPFKVDQKTKKLLAAQADVLCWFLGCENNESFRRNLDNIELAMRKANVGLVKTVTE